MNKPVAIRYDFDGYGYQYIDSGSGSDWQTRVDGEPLYTHPVKELTLTNADIEWIVKEWFNCHPEEKLTTEFAMPLYSVVDLCKAILKKAHSTCNGFCGEYECKENQTECIRKAQEK